MKKPSAKSIHSMQPAKRGEAACAPFGHDDRDGASLLYPGLLFVALPVPRDAYSDDEQSGDDITSRALDFVLRTWHFSLSPLAMGGLH